jgi:hypothetical protein
VNALERLQIVRGRNSSYFGSKYRSCTVFRQIVTIFRFSSASGWHDRSVDDSGSGFGVVLNGTFGALDSFGRTAGTLPSPAGSTAVELYLIDPGHAFFVETDLINPGSGQVGLGYFMERTPVCAGCP